MVDKAEEARITAASNIKNAIAAEMPDASYRDVEGRFAEIEADIEQERQQKVSELGPRVAPYSATAAPDENLRAVCRFLEEYFDIAPRKYLEAVPWIDEENFFCVLKALTLTELHFVLTDPTVLILYPTQEEWNMCLIGRIGHWKAEALRSIRLRTGGGRTVATTQKYGMISSNRAKDLVKAYLKRKNIARTAFAGLCGMDVKTLRGFLVTGRVREDFLKNMAQKMNTPFADLIGGS